MTAHRNSALGLLTALLLTWAMWGCDGTRTSSIPAMPEENTPEEAPESQPPPTTIEDSFSPSEGVSVTRQSDRVRLALEGDFARELYHLLGYTDRSPFGSLDDDVHHRSAHDVHCRLDTGSFEVSCELTLSPEVQVTVEEATRDWPSTFLRIEGGPVGYGAINSIGNAVATREHREDSIYFYAVAAGAFHAVRLRDGLDAPATARESVLIVTLDRGAVCSHERCPPLPTDEELLMLPGLD